MQFNKLKLKKGFSIIEVIFAVGIFAIVAVSIYQGFISMNLLISASRDKIVAADLVNSEFELIRNLSFANVGLQSGIPNGVLATSSTVTKDGRTFLISRTVRNVDDSFDGTLGGSPNDLSPADYKLVQIDISCLNCKKAMELSATAHIAPKNLETASTNGALFVRVFNANGDPVSQANVRVQNTALGVDINDETNNEGLLAIVDVPPAQNKYHITVTKNGYTTDGTYATSTGNPNPTKMDATVLLQQVTQISFVIDRISTINFASKNMQCLPIANVPFNISGSKIIGTNPEVIKWSGSYTTDSGGNKNLTNIEWDTFNVDVSSSFNLVGVNPSPPFSVLPNSIQNVDLILGTGDPHNLLVSVKDSATLLPLAEVGVVLSQGSFSSQAFTGRGYLEQTDWSAGPNQTNFSNSAMYFTDDGNIDYTSSPGELKLNKTLGNYVASGWLTSSIFDTGTSSNFKNIVWNPSDQPVQAGLNSVKFQFASSLDNTATTTWSYYGPDGTDATYYTIGNTNINQIHNGGRYFRYKVFLSTANTAYTPNIASVAVTYTSDCVPPGQALFDGLSAGNYNVAVSKTGYQNQTVPVSVSASSNWQSLEIIMSPE